MGDKEINPTYGMLEIIMKKMKEQDTNLTNPVFLSLILVGIFIKYVLGNIQASDDGSTGPATSTIWGYGIVIFSIIGVILTNIDSGSSEWNSIQKLPWPMIITVVLLMWIISLNLKYFTQINQLKVPEQYYTWSGYTSILIFALIAIAMVQYLMNSNSRLSPSMAISAKDHSAQLMMYSYILVFFNLIGITIMQVILDCFTVDG
jgi:hypothetical protein